MDAKHFYIVAKSVTKCALNVRNPLSVFFLREWSLIIMNMGVYDTALPKTRNSKKRNKHDYPREGKTSGKASEGV